jgi:hypothetical protein
MYGIMMGITLEELRSAYDLEEDQKVRERMSLISCIMGGHPATKRFGLDMLIIYVSHYSFISIYRAFAYAKSHRAPVRPSQLLGICACY